MLSEEQQEKRRGLFTASSFKLLTGKSKTKSVGKLTDTGFSYIRKKVAERLGAYEDEIKSKHLDWGNIYEPLAIKAYEEYTCSEILPQEFTLDKELKFCGATPDGLTIDNGGIEVKCPSVPSNHVRYVTDEKYIIYEHYPQIQGNIMVFELDWLDFVSFDPRSEKPLYVKRFERDDKYILALRDRLEESEEIAIDLYNQMKGIK